MPFDSQHHSGTPKKLLDETLPDGTPDGIATQREIDYLVNQLSILEKQIPTAEDLAYLRRKREEDDRVAWLVEKFKRWFPTAALVCSAIGGAVWWLLTNSITVTPNKQ